MITFEKAIDIATTNAKSLIRNSDNFVLEGALISRDKKLYEISLSYDITGKSPLETSGENSGLNQHGNLFQLAKLLSHRRENKVFLVDSSDGQFRGFMNQKN